MSDHDTGLYAKYEVKRINDRVGKHDECRYFVLDPQHDPIARYALLSYAEGAIDRGYVELARDIYDWLNEIYGGTE